jgi:cryptochrome
LDRYATGQLMWREFYYLAAAGTPNFDKMEGNRICRQIPWTWDQERLAAWEAGATGFPWIDACMHQLKAEGWMHHLARHAVVGLALFTTLFCSHNTKLMTASMSM